MCKHKVIRVINYTTRVAPLEVLDEHMGSRWSTTPLLYTARHVILHPICCLRFVSDWTQLLDILSADSEFMCYYLANKGCLGNPTLGTNLGQRILAMRTGCMPFLAHTVSWCPDATVSWVCPVSCIIS